METPTQEAYYVSHRNPSLQGLQQYAGWRLSSMTSTNLIFILLGLAFAAFVLSGIVRAHFFNPLRDIPGPWLARYTRLWLWNQYRRGQFHIINIELHRKYGKIVRIAPNEYSVDDPAAIRIIYGHGTKFTKGPWYIASGPPSQEEGAVISIFADRNLRSHAESRRKVANAYSLSALMGIEQYVDSCAELFIGHLEQFSDMREVFDLGKWLQCFAFDVIGEITFGERFGFLDHGDDIDNIMEHLEQGLRQTAPLGVYYELHYLYRQIQKLWGRFHQNASGRVAVARFTEAQIRKRIEKKSTFYSRDFLSKFMAIHEQFPSKFTREEVFQVCLTQIMAGSDTTAIALRAILYYLYNDPLRLQKVRAEIEDKAGTNDLSDPVTYRQTLDMPYLNAVIKEALRMHPATGLPLGRQVPLGGATICGRYFPPGAVVGVNTWVAHANQDVFGENAALFQPERWLVDPEQYSKLDHYFLSFGLGSRTCLGKNIALMEISKLVPQIVRNFDITFQRPWHLCNFWFVKQSSLDCTIRKIR